MKMYCNICGAELDEDDYYYTRDGMEHLCEECAIETAHDSVSDSEILDLAGFEELQVSSDEEFDEKEVTAPLDGQLDMFGRVFLDGGWKKNDSHG